MVLILSRYVEIETQRVNKEQHKGTDSFPSIVAVQS